MKRIDNRPRLDSMDVFRLIEGHIRAAGSASAFAAQLGISTGHLSDIRNARINPSPRILSQLGLRREVRYVIDGDPEAVLEMIRPRSAA